MPMVIPITRNIRTKKLGVLIKDARLASGKNIKSCADALKVSSGRISAYERGEKSPSLPELEVLAFFLDVPLEHFWGQESLANDFEERVEASKLERLIPIRQKIVGILLKKARIEADLPIKALADCAGVTTRRVKSYEAGEIPIPLPELEAMASLLNLNIEHFRDKEGVVGKWALEQLTISQFLQLPPDLQDFVIKPINRPYLEIAQRLSGMSVDKLRAVAEGLLDITL
jgi:transcriptional regulator with XRE-family HTH domain